MSTQLATIIAINATLLLVFSWVFGLHFISKLHAEKEALTNAIKQATTPADGNSDDLYTMLEYMKEEIQEKESIIASLMGEADDPATAEMIQTLKEDLQNSRKTLADIEKQLEAGQSLKARIAYLEKAECRLRKESQFMRTNLREVTDTLDKRNQQVNHLKETNDKLKQTIKTLTHASEEQMAIIKQLQDQINRAEELENYQRQLISDLEERLSENKNEREEDQDQQKIGEIESELSELRDTLKRTIIEKEFIEGHLLELDDSLEKARETEEALKHAQEEIASLEKRYPEYEPPENLTNAEAKPETTPESTENPSIGDMDMHEMEAISVDNLLFEPLEDVWNSLKAEPEFTLPELTLADENTPRPDHDLWCSLVIGDNEYTLLLSIDPTLAETLSSAIVKGETENPHHSGIKQLGQSIAQALANDMPNDQVEDAKLLEPSAAIEHIETHKVMMEIVAHCEDKAIYVALTELGE